MTETLIGLAVTLAVGFGAGLATGWYWGRCRERRRWRGRARLPWAHEHRNPIRFIRSETLP